MDRPRGTPTQWTDHVAHQPNGQTNSDLAAMGSVFAYRSFGYLAGAIGGGMLFDWATNPAMLIAMATASVAVGVFLVPFQTSVVALGVTVSFQGLGMDILVRAAHAVLQSRNVRTWVGTWVAVLFAQAHVCTWMVCAHVGGCTHPRVWARIHVCVRPQ
jgi:hypothetical protein